MQAFRRALAILLIIVLSLTVGIGADLIWTKIDETTHPRDYADLVTKYAVEYNIPEYVIYAVIKTESDFEANALSEAGAMGLMQMMPATFEWLTGDEHLDEHLDVSSLNTPDVSIRYGSYYLLYLFRRFDHNWNTVFAAYNGGEGNVAEWLENPEYSDGQGNLTYIPFKETRNYVKKVNDAIAQYEKLEQTRSERS